jgi:hypothetical protein
MRSGMVIRSRRTMNESSEPPDPTVASAHFMRPGGAAAHFLM